MYLSVDSLVSVLLCPSICGVVSCLLHSAIDMVATLPGRVYLFGCFVDAVTDPSHVLSKSSTVVQPESDWIRSGWIGLDWIGLNSIGSDQIGSSPVESLHACACECGERKEGGVWRGGRFVSRPSCWWGDDNS